MAASESQRMEGIVAKLSEAINLPVAYVADDLTAMFNTYHDWPGIPEHASWSLIGKTSDRVEVRVHGEAWGDHRRFWRLFSVWLDGKPIAVGRHAGREGDDSVDRVVLDRDGYKELVRIINALIEPVGIDDDIAALLADPDIGSVTRWYGESVRPGEVLHNIWR